MTTRLRAALGLEVVALAAPIIASIGWMVYGGTHASKGCVGGGCHDPSPIVFLFCVAAFGPPLWVVIRVLSGRDGLVRLIAASVYVVAAIVLIPLAATWIAILVPAIGLITAVVVALTAIGLLAAVVEPRRKHG